MGHMKSSDKSQSGAAVRIENLEKSFGNIWYYRQSVAFLNQSPMLQDCMRNKYLYVTLIPFLNICYAGRDIRNLPVSEIRLDYQGYGKKHPLTVTVCPE